MGHISVHRDGKDKTLDKQVGAVPSTWIYTHGALGRVRDRGTDRGGGASLRSPRGSSGSSGVTRRRCGWTGAHGAFQGWQREKVLEGGKGVIGEGGHTGRVCVVDAERAECSEEEGVGTCVQCCYEIW